MSSTETRSTEEQLRELERQWAQAEQHADVGALDALSTEDFTLVGPAGFVLTKPAWLARYRGGDLHTSEVHYHDVVVRDYGDTAVSVGVHTQQASYQGNPVNGSFRSTHIAVRRDGRWLLAGMQLSPMGGPPPFAQPPAAR